MSTTIAELPERDRPRERLAKLGSAALTEAELLALVLRNGTRGASAIELANRLLAVFGELSALAKAHVDEIARVSGIGPAKASALVAALTLASRIRHGASPSQIAEPSDIAQIAMVQLANKRRECVIALICDTANNLRHVATISEGAIDYAMLPTRETLQAVLRHDGKAFAIAHNHPSGNPKPSSADIAATRQLAHAAEMVGLRFLDHIVIAGDHWERVAIGLSR